MSLTQEEQRKLASENICDILTDSRGRVSFEFDNHGLAAYTAAVEAKEREKCAVHAQTWLYAYCDKWTAPVGIADSIRSLK